MMILAVVLETQEAHFGERSTNWHFVKETMIVS